MISFSIAIIVNFGTWAKAQIERYDDHEGIIRLSKLIMGRFRGCDRFYAVRQFYVKAIFVMGRLATKGVGLK